MRQFVFFVTALVLSGCAAEVPNCGGCAGQARMGDVRLNDIVTVGTHNSYKQAIDPRLFAALMQKAPKLAPALDYSHASLTDQLNDGARAIEIDVAYDPQGGLFAHPLGAALVGETLPDGYAQAMSKPGFKVLHVQDFDFRSSCIALRDCLAILKGWSRAHPDHVPILVTFNAKDDSLPGYTQVLKFDAAAFDAFDAEIRSVLDPKDLITPDDVQGTAPSLREAVTTKGWPTLAASRGKFILALDEQGEKRALYRGARKSLEGRVMFIDAPPGSPTAAFRVMNEALTDTAAITAAVKAGFLVRTRADADTVEARANDTRRRDAALASGAQYISTDYMRPDFRFGPYEVRLPQGVVAACNPVRAAHCGPLPEFNFELISNY
ncbi:MAG: phosphatidylinositol-specific phospholipase C1-like protein [Alphaproteobacteria bacterium]|nr:phosphatidylinositol-specific phospholipase C1-like protein [Alphaproteobacteria bacterium]